MRIQQVNNYDWYYTVVDEEDNRCFFGTKEQCNVYVARKLA